MHQAPPQHTATRLRTQGTNHKPQLDTTLQTAPSPRASQHLQARPHGIVAVAASHDVRLVTVRLGAAANARRGCAGATRIARAPEAIVCHPHLQRDRTVLAQAAAQSMLQPGTPPAASERHAASNNQQPALSVIQDCQALSHPKHAGHHTGTQASPTQAGAAAGPCLGVAKALAVAALVHEEVLRRVAVREEEQRLLQACRPAVRLHPCTG